MKTLRPGPKLIHPQIHGSRGWMPSSAASLNLWELGLRFVLLDFACFCSLVVQWIKRTSPDADAC